jgi:hypothetical protein
MAAIDTLARVLASCAEGGANESTGSTAVQQMLPPPLLQELASQLVQLVSQPFAESQHGAYHCMEAMATTPWSLAALCVPPSRALGAGGCCGAPPIGRAWLAPLPPPPLLAPCLCCVVLVQTMIELGVRAHRRRRFCQLSGAFSLAAQTCCWTRRPPTPRRHPRARGATPSSEPCSAARTPPRWWGRGWATSRSWWSGRPPRTGQRPASPVRHRR